MTTNDWQTIENAFAAISDLDGEARAAALAAFAAEHPALEAQLVALLAADADAANPADAIAAVATSMAEDAGDPWLGREVGPWRIEKRIGEGGMGAVFLARRAGEEYEQVAALKLMTSRLLSPDATARFRAERQFLARLSHPNIATLLDGGSTDDGQPYLAMEFVDGVPIDRYCDEQQLDVAARLKLFGKVCDAVDYAHRNLIVHRDIKPGNILVDEHGEPKLLDFGIAKLLEPERVDHTQAMTREGMRILTPENASPEQVRGEPPTIATDVYALGVLLYRLLTGQSPYGASLDSMAALEKAIVTDEPKRPSTVVTKPTESEGDLPSLAELSARRRTSPERLQKRLVGDLDNIVLKTLQKEPARRYASAALLRADVDNYLAQRPVTARPDSFAYRASKFLQRNALPVAAVSVFVLTVAGLVAYYTAEVAAERDRAQLQAERAGQVTNFLTDLFEEASPTNNFGKPMNARELLDAGAARMSAELGEQPELRAALAHTMFASYRNMRENRAALDFAAPLLADLREQLGPLDPAWLKLQRDYASALLTVGERDEARAILEENYAAWQQVAAPDSLDIGITLRALGVLEQSENNLAASEGHLERALDIIRPYADEDPVALTDTLMQYGVTVRNQGRYDENEAALLEAMAVQEACCGKEQPDYASLVNNLGGNYRARGQLGQAEEYYREHARLQKALVGEDGVAYANALQNIAVVTTEQGDPEGALAMQLQVREIYGRGYGTDSVPYAYVSENIANAQSDLGRYADAEANYRIAMDILEAKFGKDDVEFAITQSNYGNLLSRMARRQASLVELRAAHAIFEEEYGLANATTVGSNNKIANALLNVEDVAAARRYAEDAVAGAQAIWPGPHQQKAHVTTTLARTYRDARDYQRARELHAEAIALAAELDADVQRQVILAEIDLGKTMMRQGAEEEARALLLPRRAELVALEDETWTSVVGSIDEVLAYEPYD